MRSDRTAVLLQLLSTLQERYGPPPDRPALIGWLTAQLDAGATIDQVFTRYETHRPGRATGPFASSGSA